MKMPSLFISHGAPSLLLDNGPAAQFLKTLGKKFPKPKAILCVSAHWEAAQPLFTTSEQPDTIHDFYGFPQEMYAMRYPAKGAPEVAKWAMELCAAKGIACAADPKRGFDHGTWIPLMAMYPEADVPVIQIALPFAQGPRGVYALGEALRPLRDEGILLLGSGGFTHNLRELDWENGAPQEWSLEFHAWVSIALRENRLEDLFEAETRAPHFHRNHPRAEHWLPLYFALGAVGSPWRCDLLHTGFEMGSLSMDAYSFFTPDPMK